MNIWHKSDEKPLPGKVCLLEIRGVGKLNFVDICEATDDGLWCGNDDRPRTYETLKKWAYIEDLTKEDSGTYDPIRKAAYREVFYEFVLPLCNEILNNPDEGGMLSGPRYDVELLDDVRHYIVYGKIENQYREKDFPWLGVKPVIDKFLGKPEAPESGDGK